MSTVILYAIGAEYLVLAAMQLGASNWRIAAVFACYGFAQLAMQGTLK